MTYKDELTKGMELLAKNKKVIFLGQGIKYLGASGVMFSSLKNIPNSKKIELPIAEDMQMGLCIGLSLEGYIPITMYARMDFFILAINQLVNHLDKIEEISHGEFKPKVIIRTAVGTSKSKPLYAGLQHTSDYTNAFKCMLKNIEVIRLMSKEDIVSSYERALKNEKSTLLIELGDLYDTG